jgi:FlaA1/EpsC-like NDP-sugar epimerase
VVPIFKDQIEHGGPLTVTDREATLYFMSLAEAAGSVLQATAMSVGGDIFHLDMGEPVKILDLAETMITLLATVRT